MGQSVKCLLSKPKDLSLSPQNHIENNGLGMSAHVCNSNIEEAPWGRVKSMEATLGCVFMTVHTCI